jgi:hypothetical protein
METLLIYLVKSSGLIGMFYLAYYFLLRKETFFNSNRWFLLAGLITSVILPLIVFTKIIWVNPSPTPFDWSKIPVTTTSENEAFEISWYLAFSFIYSIGILVFLMKFAFDFYSLSKVLKGKTIQQQGDFKFIDVVENVSPFSYFNSIVYNSSLYSDSELENILEHEKVHSSQNHTIDVLISRLFCIVFWFNPLIWFYKKAIVQNLEFIADSEASKNISDKKAYQLTLLKITTQENCVVLTNHFYQSLIKKRIVMLNKNQSNKRNYWKYVVVLPLLGAFLFFFQVKVVAQEKVAPKQETKPNNIEITTIKKDSITYPKGTEIYINGEKSSQEELDKIDPKEIEKVDIIKKSDNPKILVTTKHLTKPVKITDKDIYIDGVKVSNEEFSELDPNAIDKVEVNTFENSVKITTKTINISADNFNNKIISKDSKEKPIIIINGKRTLATFDISTIDNKQIESINVLKGRAAEEKYGKDAKNGVIEISTKKDVDGLKQSSTKVKIETELDKSENKLVDLSTKSAQVNKGNGWAISYGASESKDNIKRIQENKNVDYKKAVIFIDGKLSDSQTLEKLDPEEIGSVGIQKTSNYPQSEQQAVIKKYGEKAQNGVITIETKEYKSHLKPSPTKAKKESELDKSEIDNTGNETVSSYKQYLEMYKTLFQARFSLERMKVKNEQAKVQLEKARIALKSKLFS